MKKMRKLLIPLTILAMLAMPVFAQAEDVEGLSAKEAAEKGQVLDADRAQLENYVVESIKWISSMSDAEINETVNPSTILESTSENAVQSVQSWKDMKDTLGEFVEAKEHEIIVDSSTITVISTCDFTNGEGTVTTTLDRKASPLVATVIFSEGEESFASTMQKAAMNTIMGLGIVFCTLLFLSFLIGQFKHIAKLENGFKKKEAAPAPKPAAPATPAPAASAPVAEETVDNNELIAVIAAAIAAAEGTSTDGFVVRSIKKRERSKWQRA